MRGMKAEKNPRGVFERPPGSGVWWVNYYVRGQQHREKVGRKSDAIALYQKRKADTRRVGTGRFQKADHSVDKRITFVVR